MDLIRTSINRPVGVTVGVALVVMFGLISLFSIPIQLTPTVDYPIVTVSTTWPGRSPEEVVDEITREQEKRLKNVANLKSMRSSSNEGSAQITLEFYLGSSIDRAMQEVSDALRQVPSYPDEVNEPIIKAADGASENAIAWIIIDLDDEVEEAHPEFDITTLFDSLEKEVKPLLERIDGVAEINIYGGREREVRVLVDPVALAQRALTHADILNALQSQNRNVSAGTIADGKRDIRVRIVGQFVTESDVLDTVVTYRDGKPVYVRDLATVEFGYQKQRGFVRSLGKPSLAMNCIRQSNANVVSVMRELRARLADIRAEILPRLGPIGPDGQPVVGHGLRMRQVYDETTYIDAAIDLVLGNLWLGGLIAGGVLLLFLRSFIATGIIAIAIPISVIGTFLAMVAFGRTINVISLAGLAFATGMVVDNAIVVLENIVRRRQMGDGPIEATYRGTREVWTAILASTLTTVAVFVPILTIQEEAGQLFRDISLAIAASVTLSVIVAVTVVPAACGRVLRLVGDRRPHGRLWNLVHNLFGLAPLAARLVDALASFVMYLCTSWRAWLVRPALIILVAAYSLVGSKALMPPLDYLPTGNRNLVFGGLAIPPGYSLPQMTSIAERLESDLAPYVTRNDEQIKQLPPIPMFPGPGAPLFEPVAIENFFIGSFGGGLFVGATSQDPERVIPVGSLLTNFMNTIPAAFGGARQTSIFSRGIRGSNSVNIEFSGPRLDRVTSAAAMAFNIAGSDGHYGMRNLGTTPGNYTLTQQELRIRLNERGRELGLSTRDVGVAVRGLFDGAFADDFRLAGDTVDMVLIPEGGRLPSPEVLPSIPIATPVGRTVPLSTVVDVVETSSPQEIYRVEELPSVSIQVTPPPNLTIEELMNDIRKRVITPVTQAGLIDPTMRIRLEGTAADLDSVHASLLGEQASPQTSTTRTILDVSCLAVVALGGAVGLGACFRTRSRLLPASTRVAGVAGFILLAAVIAASAWLIGSNPNLLGARLVWALLVTYLLMCALFESFLYPLVIMLSVPLAMIGGFGGLAVVHWWTLQNPAKAAQQLDVVTMLGFVILIGTVVNNAILIVEQTLNFMDPRRFGSDEPRLSSHEAIRQSVRTRIRPILMTTATTVGGMLPLVASPGAGSEMYRGLGAVVLGGLICSTLFSLVLIPLVLSLVFDLQTSALAILGLGQSNTAPEQGQPIPA